MDPPPRRINLALGYPHPALLPVGKMQEASTAAFARPEMSGPRSALEYGPDQGSAELRQEIAEWLTTFYGRERPQQISPERICITGGASQNLACILQTYTDPIYTRNVWMVAPTYHLAWRIFDDSGLGEKLRPVPEDVDGLDIDFLSRQIIQPSEDHHRAVVVEEPGNLSPTTIKPPRPWRKTYRHVIYAVPTFSNPTGKVMSLRRREALVRIARANDALVITDDVYDMLQWSSSLADDPSPRYPKQACLPRIVDIDAILDGGPVDEYGNAVSNGSFSKIIGPGCRTGWAEGTPVFAYGLSQTGSNRSGGCASQLTASFIHQMLLRRSLQQHINTVLQPAYARRYHTLMSAIRDELLPMGVTSPEAGINGIVGGYFVWITVPATLDSDNLVQRASKEENLVLLAGTTFQVHGAAATSETNSFINNIRICFSWEEEELLAEGIKRLARVLRRSLAALT